MPVRGQAISAVQQWRQAQEILIGTTPPDKLYLTVRSATHLPRPRNIMIKVVMYATNNPRTVWQWRDFEETTPVVKNSQNPEWNHNFSITCPEYPKFLDLEVHDYGSLKDKEIGRIRLKFTNIPGVERNLEGRSLMFAYDGKSTLPYLVFNLLIISTEDISYQIPITEGKGKEIEPPLLHIHLKWKGRFFLLEKPGLPMSAPGKLFKPNLSGMPMPFEDGKDTSTLTANRSSSSFASGMNVRLREAE